MMTWREKWASAGPLKYVYVFFGVIGVLMAPGVAATIVVTLAGLF